MVIKDKVCNKHFISTCRFFN